MSIKFCESLMILKFPILELNFLIPSSPRINNFSMPQFKRAVWFSLKNKKNRNFLRVLISLLMVEHDELFVNY